MDYPSFNKIMCEDNNLHMIIMDSYSVALLDRLLNLFIRTRKDFIYTYTYNMNHKATSRNSQCQTTYQQVILQVSHIYFPETSGFCPTIPFTHENIGDWYCALLNDTFMSYIQIQVSLISKFSDISIYLMFE